MNRPPDRASIKLPRDHVGSNEVSLSLRIALCIVTTLLVAAAGSVAMTQSRTLEAPLRAKVLHDPDRVLSPSTLRPSASAWQDVERVPIEHPGGTTWLLVASEMATAVEVSTMGSERVRLFAWSPQSNPPSYQSIDDISHSITRFDLKPGQPILVQLQEESKLPVTLRKPPSHDSSSFARLLIQFLIVVAGLVLVCLNGVETLVRRAPWSVPIAAVALSLGQVTVLLAMRAGFTTNDVAGFHYQDVVLTGWFVMACALLLKDPQRPSSRATRYGALCIYAILFSIVPSDTLTTLLPILVLALAIYHAVNQPLATMFGSVFFYTLLAVNSTWLNPSWPDQYLAIYSVAVGLLVLSALIRVVSLLRTFAQQRYAFEKLQYELKHEHSARLYITSSTAHELNNPINFISSGVGLQLEQFGELRDLVDVVFHEVEDPDALDLKQRFDSTLRSILNITLDIQAGALRSAASLDHLRGLSPSNAEIMSTFWTVDDILSHAIDRVELQYMQHARTHLMLDLSTEQRRKQLSTNLYFLSDAIGKLIVMALTRSPNDRNVVRVHLETEDALARLKISYPGSLPESESQQHNMDRLDHLEHIYECLQLVGCTMCCSYDANGHSSTFTILIPTQGVLK